MKSVFPSIKTFHGGPLQKITHLSANVSRHLIAPHNSRCLIQLVIVIIILKSVISMRTFGIKAVKHQVEFAMNVSTIPKVFTVSDANQAFTTIRLKI